MSEGAKNINVEQDLEWFRDARFGLFIHWGIYSDLAGVWKGERIPWIGEQIMRSAEISNKDYMPVADTFNPVKYNADEWVSLAAKAGMKYVVITAKHHDGFAMYKSDCSDYNIVDGSPYGKDPMVDLAEACRKYGLKLCFYYSHVQDWNHPDAPWQEWEGQYDVPAEERDVQFDRYMEEKGLPQVRELLTNYGDVGLIWFDTWGAITPEQAQVFYDTVKETQATTLVNGRLFQEMGDYKNLGDNEIPSIVQYEQDFETLATMNNTWGFKSWDHEWKSCADFIYALVTCVSRNGNYLLNVGPTGEGLIPQASVDLLEEIGEWMDVNAEAIHGCAAAPFLRDFPWGTVTAKDNKLFLHVFKWPTQGSLTFRGLETQVQSVKLLAGNQNVAFKQEGDLTTIELPIEAPTLHCSVIELNFDETPTASKELFQFADASITLPSKTAEAIGVDADSPSTIEFAYGGETEGFNPQGGSLKWTFNISEPGRF